MVFCFSFRKRTVKPYKLMPKPPCLVSQHRKLPLLSPESHSEQLCTSVVVGSLNLCTQYHFTDYEEMGLPLSGAECA